MPEPGTCHEMLACRVLHPEGHPLATCRVCQDATELRRLREALEDIYRNVAARALRKGAWANA